MITAVKNNITLRSDLSRSLYIAEIDNNSSEVFNVISDVEVLDGVTTKKYSTRADVKAITNLVQDNKISFEGSLFTFKQSNYSQMVTDDPREAIVIPPNSDLTGASGAWVRSIESVLKYEWFGGQANGTNETAILKDFLSFSEKYSLEAKLPEGIILVDPDQISIGNATETTTSTLNGQIITGAGAGSYSNEGATVIRARVAGTSLFTLKGTTSAKIRGVKFDCDGLVEVAINCVSINSCIIEQFTCLNFTKYGLVFNTYSGATGVPFWCATNRVSEFFITSVNCLPFAAGLFLTGVISENYDPHRNTFTSGITQLRTVSTTEPVYGAFLKFCDSNTFIECDLSVYGPSTDVGYGLGLSDADNPGNPYPQNNNFISCSLSGGGPSGVVGGVSVIETNATGIGKNMFVSYPTADNEPVPDHPKLLGYTDTFEFFGDMVLSKEFSSLSFRTDSSEYRVFHNASDASNQGFNMEKFNGVSWKPLLRFDSGDNPYINFEGLGLRGLKYGTVDTGGTGFRRIVVDN